MKTPWWFLKKNPVAFLLWPAGVVYYLVSRVVFFLRRFGAYRSRRPIVCVGNLFAGGVGKTPVVRAIATVLDAPVVMRGYKKSAATNGAGDEATMLARAGLQVHTGDRKSNIMLLDRQDGNGPIVMDDGFQNPTIKKDVSILVFDEKMGFGNGFLLPAGPLREGKGAISRADAAIVIKSDKPNPKFGLPSGLPVFYAQNKTINPYDEDTRIVAFAGIGYPKKFFAALDNVVASKSFPDHYQYTDADIEKLMRIAARKKAKLVTTEKDWVRLPAPAREVVRYARLDTVIDNTFFTWLKERLDANR